MKIWISILSLLGSMGTFLLIKNSQLLGVIGIRISVLICIAIFMTNLLVGKIAEIIKKTCVPDIVYYNRSFDLIKIRFFWSFGIHMTPIFLVSFYGIGVLGQLNWWQLLFVIILTSVLNFVIDTMDKTEN